MIPCWFSPACHRLLNKSCTSRFPFVDVELACRLKLPQYVSAGRTIWSAIHTISGLLSILMYSRKHENIFSFPIICQHRDDAGSSNHSSLKIMNHLSSVVSTAFPDDFSFNIFINDIFLLDMSCSIYNYADDNCISYSHNKVDCIKSVLSDEINSLMTWFKLNSLVANPNKFRSMLISPNAPKRSWSSDWGQW